MWWVNLKTIITIQIIFLKTNILNMTILLLIIKINLLMQWMYNFKDNQILLNKNQKKILPTTLLKIFNQLIWHNLHNKVCIEKILQLLKIQNKLLRHKPQLLISNLEPLTILQIIIKLNFNNNNNKVHLVRQRNKQKILQREANFFLKILS